MYSIDNYQALVVAFEDVLAKLNELCLHIHDELKNYPVWIMQDEAFVADRDKVIYALKHFSPASELSAQATLAFPGVVGGTQKTIKLIEAVNKAKDALKLEAENYKSIFKANPTRTVREILSLNGHAFVKLKQVYRHIHFIPYHPTRISWGKWRAYSNTKINIEQAREKLKKAGRGEHIDIQLSKLDLLKPTDHLVIQRQIQPVWFANISKGRKGKLMHEQITTSLPIFYLHDDHRVAPDVDINKKSVRTIKRRADKLIEDTPFLKSISAYRYKIEYNMSTDKATKSNAVQKLSETVVSKSC